MNKKRYLQEGDVIDLVEGDHICAEICLGEFGYENVSPQDRTKERSDFVIGQNGGKLMRFAGRYIVTKTTCDGGGQGMGPHDVYPDGHHVFCQSVDCPSLKVEFYQTGCFRAMIEDVEPVGRAEQTWRVVELFPDTAPRVNKPEPAAQYASASASP